MLLLVHCCGSTDSGCLQDFVILRDDLPASKRSSPLGNGYQHLAMSQIKLNVMTRAIAHAQPDLGVTSHALQLQGQEYEQMGRLVRHDLLERRAHGRCAVTELALGVYLDWALYHLIVIAEGDSLAMLEVLPESLLDALEPRVAAHIDAWNIE